MKFPVDQVVLEEGGSHCLDSHRHSRHSRGGVGAGVKGEQGFQAVDDGAVTDPHCHSQEHQGQHHVHYRQGAGVGHAAKLGSKNHVYQGQQHRAHAGDHHPQGQLPHFAPQLVGNGLGVLGAGVVVDGLPGVRIGDGGLLRGGIFQFLVAHPAFGGVFPLLAFSRLPQLLRFREQGALQHFRVDDVGGHAPGPVLVNAGHLGRLCDRPVEHHGLFLRRGLCGSRCGGRLGDRHGLGGGFCRKGGRDRCFRNGRLLGHGPLCRGGLFHRGLGDGFFRCAGRPGGQVLKGKLLLRRLGIRRRGGFPGLPFGLVQPDGLLHSGLFLGREFLHRLGCLRWGGRFHRGGDLRRGLLGRKLFHGFQGGVGPQHPTDSLLGNGGLLAHPLELHCIVEHVQLDLHGLVVGGFQHGFLQAGHLLVALHANAVLAGVGVGCKGGHRHGGHHAELVGDLFLVHPGGLDRFRHPASAFLLQPLEVLFHLVVNGLFGVIKQGFIGFFLAGQLPCRVVALAVLVDGLQLDAVIQVVLVFVKVRHPLFPAKQPPALLFLVLFTGSLFLHFPAVLLPQGEFHRARGIGVQVGLGLLPGLCRLLPLRLGSLGLLLGRLRLLGLGGLACRALGGPCPGLAGLPFLRKVFPGGLLGGFHLPFGPLFRQDILQGKFLVVL